MATTFQVKRSSVAGKVPNTSTLSIGELGLNLTDQVLYSSNGTGVFELGANVTNQTVKTSLLIGNSSVNTVINSSSISVSKVVANGAFGTNGQILVSNGTSMYWDNPAGGTQLIKQQYTANGTQSEFTVTGGYTSNNLQVYLNGVLLRNGVEANVQSGSTFTISPTPSNGSLIDVYGISTLYANGVSTVVSQQFTANGTANSFTITNGYIPNQIQVFLNGVKQVPSVDIDVSSGSTVNFVDTPANGYVVDVYGYQTSVSYYSNNLIVGNVSIGTDTISVGNSSVNTQIVAGNVFLNGSTLVVGNTSTNVTINSTSVAIGANNLTVGTSLYAVSNGNVGIGRSSPSFTLDVNGSARSDYILFGSNSSAPTADAAIYRPADGTLGLVTASTERMRITSAGNVGIGTTNPGQKLHVAGNIAMSPGTTILAADSTSGLNFSGGTAWNDGGVWTTYGSAAGASSNKTYFAQNGTIKFIIDGDGNVGIGTSSPKSSLHISGSSVLQQSYQTYLVNAYYDGAWKYIENGMAWGIGNNFGGPTNGMCIATATVNSSGNDAALTWLPRLNIDSSGNVGIGTSSPSSTLHVYGAGASELFNNQIIVQSNQAYNTSPTSAILFRNNYTSGGDIAGMGAIGVGKENVTDANFAGFMAFGTRPAGGSVTERMRISSIGNVGIGTSSPGGKLHISDTGASYIFTSNSTSFYTTTINMDNTGLDIGHNSGSRSINFLTASTERMRIESGGTVHIGKTTGSVTTNGLSFYPGGALHHIFTITSNEAVIFNNLTSATTYTLSFRTSNNQRGSISVSDSAVAYNTSSDYRLKENIVPLNDAIRKLNLLKPRRFNFKSEPDKVIEGFIAHEVAEIVPNAITGEKDAVDDEGNIKPQGMDASKLIPLLTSALQEAVSRINVLEQRIEQLETN